VWDFRRGSMPDIEDYIEQKKVDNDILNYPFLRDDNGKVNLNHYGTGWEFRQKLGFLTNSFKALRDTDKVQNDFEAFRKKDYDEIMTSLIKNGIVYDYPKYRSVQDDYVRVTEVRLRHLYNENKIGYGLEYGACSPLASSPTDTFEYDFPQREDNTLSFKENYQDISLGRWLVNGVKKAVKFIQSL